MRSFFLDTLYFINWIKILLRIGYNSLRYCIVLANTLKNCIVYCIVKEIAKSPGLVGGAQAKCPPSDDFWIELQRLRFPHNIQTVIERTHAKRSWGKETDLRVWSMWFPGAKSLITHRPFWSASFYGQKICLFNVHQSISNQKRALQAQTYAFRRSEK